MIHAYAYAIKNLLSFLSKKMYLLFKKPPKNEYDRGNEKKSNNVGTYI